MASSSTASYCSSGSLHEESGLLSSDRGLGMSRNPQSLAVQAPISSMEMRRSSHDRQAGSSILRSCNGAVISGFAIAATTAFGLSVFAFDGSAIAAELDVNSTTIAQVASTNSSSNERVSSSQTTNDRKNYNPASFPSINSKPASDFSFSIAIPIPHEQEWIIVRKGYIAPSPRMQTHAASSSLKCPQWTPSELEMFLPDFNGRPKPFPRQGHHWSASYVVRGKHNEAFLQLADLQEDAENEVGMYAKTSSSAEIDKKEMEGRRSLLKMLGMERFTCFSM